MNPSVGERSALLFSLVLNTSVCVHHHGHHQGGEPGGRVAHPEHVAGQVGVLHAGLVIQQAGADEDQPANMVTN